LQLYFDNGQLDTMISIKQNTTGIYPQVIPQVSNPQGNVLTDTINWNLIMGSFIANGTEQYLTIGNFKSDSATTKVVFNLGTIDVPASELLIDDVSVYPMELANWLPDSASCAWGDSATIGLPNYQTPDAKWYTYNMQLIDSGSQIKVLPTQAITQYICGIDMCNTIVYDTITVYQWPLGIMQQDILHIKVYPNPTSHGFYIKAAEPQGNIVVEVLDVQGKVVATQHCVLGKQACYMPINLASGIYIVNIYNNGTKVKHHSKLQIIQ
jgi:hypothetical protein